MTGCSLVPEQLASISMTGANGLTGAGTDILIGFMGFCSQLQNVRTLAGQPQYEAMAGEGASQ